MTAKLVLACLALTFAGQTVQAADLVRGVRFKLSAGDLASGVAAVEDYKKTTGVDVEYLNAVGWLARGAEQLRRNDLAAEYVAELRRQIPSETPELVVPLGAAIEVEGKLVAARDGRGAAIRYLEGELAQAHATPLRARIRKNINLLSLEGQPAPAVAGDFIGITPPSLASQRGSPVVLFFWYQGCGDCKAQSVSLARVWQKYRTQGVKMMAVTRLYGDLDDKPATPADEKKEIEKVWKETYAGLEGVPVVIDTETIVRYGVSATPTFALIDRRGVVRLYTPTRLSEAELSRKLDALLSEAP